MQAKVETRKFHGMSGQLSYLFRFPVDPVSLEDKNLLKKQPAADLEPTAFPFIFVSEIFGV